MSLSESMTRLSPKSATCWSWRARSVCRSVCIVSIYSLGKGSPFLRTHRPLSGRRLGGKAVPHTGACTHRYHTKTQWGPFLLHTYKWVKSFAGLRGHKANSQRILSLWIVRAAQTDSHLGSKCSDVMWRSRHQQDVVRCQITCTKRHRV